MVRSLQIFLVIVLLQGIILKLYAQTKINSCLYIGGKDKYVLSEKIKLDGGETQTFNSLFIWDKDKVIRIVFLYDRKFPALSKSTINHLKSFESFLPTFREVTWHEHTKKGVVYIIGIYSYEGTFTDKGKGDIGGYEYATKLKTVIDARNKKYNPLADKFGSIDCQDCDHEVMIYNEKRKGKEINNLPLLINSVSGDSSYIISPIHIDIYRVDNSEKDHNSLPDKLTGYKLYSTVSFLSQSVIFPTKKFNYEPYKWQGRFIEENTLPYLYKSKSSMDTATLINELSELPLSAKETYFNTIKFIEPQIVRNKILSKKDSIRIIEYSNNRRKDSIKMREYIKSQFLRGDHFDYQYCAECYNDETSKAEKIKRHCPLKIALYKAGYDENWSYAFSDKYKHYFKVEQRNFGASNVIKYSTDQLNSNEWLLMSPGIGYWMSDVSNYYSLYSTNFNNLFLNEKKITE
jgi:hypothetical protein